MSADDLTGVVGDRYVIGHRLGDGTTSAVFAAHDRVLDRAVALKLLDGSADETAGDRMVRAARAMARLSHLNVIPIFDAGVAADGKVFVAMELVVGATLDRWSRERSTDAAAIVAAFAAAGRGLAAAHAAGLVHRDFDPENVMVGTDGRVRVLDVGLVGGADPETDARDDQVAFCVALATALGGEVRGATPRLPATAPSWVLPVLRRGLAPRHDDGFSTMDELVAALRPPSPRRRSRVVWVAGAAVVIVLGAGLAIRWASRQRAPAAAAPPAGVGFRCGPALETYTVVGTGDSRGVRCVLLARDQDGTPWLAWYGEGVEDGVRYRQVGEGRLGGDGAVVAITGNREGALHLGPAGAGPRPARIQIGGALDETWIRTAGTHADYTTVFDEPIRTCGPTLTGYRVFRHVDGLRGSAIACAMPGGRTWLGTGSWNGKRHLHVGTGSFEEARAPIAADLCNAQGVPCGDVAHGELTILPRAFPGVGDGFDLSGAWPEAWFPSTRDHAVRIHAVRIVDAGTRDAPTAVADIERAVRRANELLEPSGIDVFFVAAEDGPDVATVTGDAAASYERRFHAAQPTTTMIVFRAGATGGCSPSTPHDRIELSLVGDVVPHCARPWDDRLAHALVYHLGFAAIPDVPPPPWWLRMRGLE